MHEDRRSTCRPRSAGIAYLIYVLTYFLGKDLCGFIEMLVNVLGSIVVNPYYRLDHI